MKKIILICALVLCLLLCGCSEIDSVESVETNEKSMFVEIEHTIAWRIVYHRDTKVMHAISYGSYNVGTFTLLVNADGTPMIYGE